MTYDWMDEIFSSAEIEEMTYKFKQVIEEEGEPLHLDLWFAMPKAKDFVDTAFRSQFDPSAAFKLASFCRYLAQGVQGKIDERENGTE